MKHFVCFTIVCSLFLHKLSFAQSPLDSIVNVVVSSLSLNEKVEQLSRNDMFTTADNTRLNIPGFVMSDGPHGIRYETATCFPVGIAQAASWDRNLVYRIGKALGEEFNSYGIHQPLGPCLDLCRDPRNGRSPETGGEDPYLCGQLGVQYVKGMQTTPAIATLKHYNAVNRQNERTDNDYTLTTRQLYEHYGYNFRMAVQEGGALSVMNAFNLINGVECIENVELTQNILRNYWGFPHYVVSDWWAVVNVQRSMEAGVDVCMGGTEYADSLAILVNNGTIDTALINRSVAKVLQTKMLSGMLDELYPNGNVLDVVYSEEHRALSLESSRKAMVLLKNENNILPLDANSNITIALIGPSANEAQLDGFGSSEVTEPTYTVSPREGIQSKISAANVRYAFGCDINSADESGFTEALQIAETSDYVVFVGGLDETQEGEGYGIGGDRYSGSVMLPGKQLDLINALSAVNPNIIVVLKSGGICAVNPAIDNIKGFIYAFYPGQDGGNAIADVIFGDYNPAGRLPVTMPKHDEQMPEWNDDFTDDFNCGYRWYDEMDINPEFAFGFGLSYTSFEYSNLVAPFEVKAGAPFTISCNVTNTGSRSGEEVAQLYISDLLSSVWMPEKELKGFERIHLEPGETKTVEFNLSADDFYFYNDITEQYEIEAGVFTIHLGGSSDSLVLSDTLEILQTEPKSDLRITNIITYPRYPKVGDNILFAATVKNEGIASTMEGDSSKLSFFINGEEVTWNYTFKESIPPGGMKLVIANAGDSSYFWKTNLGGDYVLKAQADANYDLAEISEQNNTFSTVLRVQYGNPNANLALNKPITASSSSWFNASEQANDGNPSTRWASNNSDPVELEVDLEYVYALREIRLLWYTSYSTNYVIELSTDGSNWVNAIVQNNGSGGTEVFELADSARYVRIYATAHSGSAHSLYEIEVYGDFPQEVYLQELQLNEGWNLVSLYNQPLVSDVQTIFSNASCIKTDSLLYLAHRPEYFNSLKGIEAGNGYLIYNEVNEKILVSGTPIDSAFNQTLSSGWNLIGVPQSSPIQIDNLPDGALEVKNFDGFYNFPNATGNLYELKPGEAYFIR